MEIALKPWGSLLLRWVIGWLFIVAGVLKVMDPVAFVQAIEGYRILSGPPASLLALYLPWLEILCGAGLLTRRFFYTGSLALLTALTLVFIVALVSAWARGLDIECGCFGPSGSVGQIGIALVRDFVLLAALVWLWLEEQKSARPV
ncbi:MAG: DoxX family protein [Chthoniobacteraceae bacterium]